MALNLQAGSKLELSVRARWGLMLLGVLLAGWLATELHSAVDLKRETVERRTLQLETRRLALTNTDWAAEAAGAQISVAEIEANFWRASTDGIASASVRGEVEQIVRDVGLRRVRISLSEPTPVEGIDDFRLIEIRLEAEDRGGQFANIILALERASGALALSSFEYSRQRRQFSIVLIAPVVIGGEGGEA